MCGRYAAAVDPDDLVEIFEVEVAALDRPTRSVLKSPQQPAPGSPDYNMAPTKAAPVVLARPNDEQAPDDAARELVALRQLRLLTWGLVPSWSKDPSTGVRMINARAETLLDKPAYRRAAAARRCLVPADGWYEWQPSPVAKDGRGRPRKQPFYLCRDDEQPLAMAGVYEFWKDPDLASDDPQAWLVSFAVVTTTAEPGLDRIHPRQPVVLDPPDWAAWLDPAQTDSRHVSQLLSPHAPGRFRAWPVSTAVNSARNSGAELLRPLPEQDLVGVVDPDTGEVLGG
ncbi:MAG: SOS response-associated peptidase [Ornithinimicrobium sp.]|uniref:SOS response-associated peptidase n=1 Tax=Ornithinimicrobium sp. TaxID=1977084 RepID=UPI003D9BAF4A